MDRDKWPCGPEFCDAPRDKFVRVCGKIGSSPKSLVERLVDYKIYALLVVRFIGSVADPDEPTLLGKSRASQRLAAGAFNAILSMAGTDTGLSIDGHGIHSFAARFRVATL